MTQSSDVALTHGSTTSTALGIVIPANSQIMNINIVVEQLTLVQTQHRWVWRWYHCC